MHPIGLVRAGRAQPTDDHWGRERARIELDASRFGEETVRRLAVFGPRGEVRQPRWATELMRAYYD